MPRILICTRHPEHWDAILPVLPWLEDTGAHLVARRGRNAPTLAEIREVSQAIDLPAVGLSRTRGSWRRPSLLLGTVDDLPLLTQSARGAPFVALARLPVPVTLLSSPMPPRLQGAVQESQAGPLGELLTPSNPGAFKALAERTEGRPFVVTGCAELDQDTEDLEPAGRVVILHPGDLVDESLRGDEPRRRHLRVLDRLLTPLLSLERSVELRTSICPGPQQKIGDLAEAARQIGTRRTLSVDRVEIHSSPGWSQLASAAAVLALSFGDLLRALAAGSARVWYLPFVRSQLRPGAEAPLPGLTISSWARYARWVEESGWYRPSEDAMQTARLLAEPSDGRAAERMAQLIMAIAEWDSEADED